MFNLSKSFAARCYLAPVLFLLIASPALAQTATGVGVGTSNSESRSRAVSVSQGGSSSLTLNSNVPSHTSATITERNVPPVAAPGLGAAGLETCLGSVSGGAAVVGFGASFGTTVPDPGCAARLDARTLWAMGLKRAAVARLCITPEIYRSMPEVCATYLPSPEGVAVAEVEYTGGPIELVEGKTGELRLCNNYDVTRKRCRVWAHGPQMAAAPRR